MPELAVHRIGPMVTPDRNHRRIVEFRSAAVLATSLGRMG